MLLLWKDSYMFPLVGLEALFEAFSRGSSGDWGFAGGFLMKLLEYKEPKTIIWQKFRKYSVIELNIRNLEEWTVFEDLQLRSTVPS